MLAAESAKAQMGSLEAERTLAEAELKRYSDLREKNFISQAEYDRRASAFSTADAKLGAVRAQYRQAANQAAYAMLSTDTAGPTTPTRGEAGPAGGPAPTRGRHSRAAGEQER